MPLSRLRQTHHGEIPVRFVCLCLFRCNGCVAKFSLVWIPSGRIRPQIDGIYGKKTPPCLTRSQSITVPWSCVSQKVRQRTQVSEKCTGSAMLLNLGGPLVSSHAAMYPLLPHVCSASPERLVSSGRTRPNSVGPRFLHPTGTIPDGVHSSFFKLQPRATPTTHPAPRSPSSPGSSEVGESATTTAVATTPSVAEEVAEALDVKLVEETDLPDISALLAEVRIQTVRTSTITHVRTSTEHSAFDDRLVLLRKRQ